VSYDIVIGNVLGAKVDDDLEDEYIARLVVSEHKDGITFPYDVLNGENSRMPGYSQWNDFCDETGLRNLFFDPNEGLMRSHPGAFALKPSHLARVQEAVIARYKACPGREPGWDFDPHWRKVEEDDGVRGRDPNLARLLWLEYWIDRALKGDKPVIQNW